MKSNHIDRSLAQIVDAHVDNDFPDNLLPLTDALCIRREQVAQALLAGQQQTLTDCIGVHLHCPDVLRQQARTYVLPERFRDNAPALLAHLYRLRARGRDNRASS